MNNRNEMKQAYWRLSKGEPSPKKDRFCGIHILPKRKDGTTIPLDEGKRFIDLWPEEACMQFLPEFRDVPASDLLNCGCIASQHVISQRLKDLLGVEGGINRDREDVQFLPVRIHEKGNHANSLGTYYIMNVLRTLEGVVDREHSKVILDKSSVLHNSVITPVFLRSRIPADVDIFRIPELTLAVYVSSRIRRLMRSKKYGLNLTGVRFTEVRVTDDAPSSIAGDLPMSPR